MARVNLLYCVPGRGCVARRDDVIVVTCFNSMCYTGCIPEISEFSLSRQTREDQIQAMMTLAYAVVKVACFTPHSGGMYKLSAFALYASSMSSVTILWRRCNPYFYAVFKSTLHVEPRGIISVTGIAGIRRVIICIGQSNILYHVPVRDTWNMSSSP